MTSIKKNSANWLEVSGYSPHLPVSLGGETMHILWGCTRVQDVSVWRMRVHEGRTYLEDALGNLIMTYLATTELHNIMV